MTFVFRYILSILSFLTIATTAQAVCPQLSSARTDVLYCEDFEAPALNSSLGWTNRYGSPVNGCHNNSLSRDIEGTCPTCCMNIVQEGACEVPGENDCVFSGGNSMGHRFRPGYVGGIVGETRFTSQVLRTFGITYALKFTNNFSDPPVALKHNEFGINRDCLVGCATTNQVGPNLPFTANFFGDGSGGFGNPTVLVGLAANLDNGVAYAMSPRKTAYEWRGSIRPGDDSDKVVFGPGQWGCFQTHYRGFGTTNAEVRYWMNGKLIVHVRNLDMTHLQDPDQDPRNGNQAVLAGMDRFAFNHYFNARGVYTNTQVWSCENTPNTPPCTPQTSGYVGTTVAYRLEDNLVINSGNEPVSCSEIGFNNFDQPRLQSPVRPQTVN